MIAVIMAGGKGTRLSALTKDEIPKPMMPVCGKPLLLRQIEALKENGIKEFVLIIGHLGDVIKNYFGDGKNFGVKISYITENQPLGSAGALFYLKGRISDDFLLVFGDTVFDIDIGRMAEFHKRNAAEITLFAHPNSHPYDSDLIECSHDGRVTAIIGKGEKKGFYRNLVNAAFFILNPSALDVIGEPRKLGFEKDVVCPLIARGRAVYCYRSTEYIKDAGTVDRIAAVAEDIENGVVTARNLKNKQKAVFLDRDGTINVHIPFISRHEDVALIDGVADAIKRLNRAGWLVFVVTNQPVIARGECTFEELETIHRVIEMKLGESGAYIDDWEFCPHHPHGGYEGEVAALKIDCPCRKPKTGMIDKLAEKYNVDLRHCWLVGDTTIDIQTAKNAGMSSILVKTGMGGSDNKYNVQPDFVCADLSAAADVILEK